MGAVVGPDAPIVVSLSLGILAVLVVQEGDHLLQHRLSDRKARAKNRSREAECEVRADSFVCHEVLETPARACGRIVVKLDTLV